jgi:HD-GYP domain-containing protein (c-di-GMP phosphodiesterase class II)
VLELFHRAAHSLDAEHGRFCDSLAAQAAVAIHNATLFQDLQRSEARLASAYDATLEGWSRALDLRDKETEGHTQRVTAMTLCLAESVGMSADSLVHVRRGALLHDIGKMGVPDQILPKPGPLTRKRRRSCNAIPTWPLGDAVADRILRPALEILVPPRALNGSGYPRGLRRQQIPLAARIFAVVDAWDALLLRPPVPPRLERRRCAVTWTMKPAKRSIPKWSRRF